MGPQSGEGSKSLCTQGLGVPIVAVSVCVRMLQEVSREWKERKTPLGTTHLRQSHTGFSLRAFSVKISRPFARAVRGLQELSLGAELAYLNLIIILVITLNPGLVPHAAEMSGPLFWGPRLIYK